jgi:hypothetical protein
MACLLALASMAGVSPARAGEPAPVDDTEIWLVTYGPGEVYWQRFGHNAIWVRDARLGLDHTFNFGFFDFEQERFFQRFLLGRMLYFAAAQEAGEEFAQYLAENREIRAQRLALDRAQASALSRHLLRAVQPENRDYLYHYYSDNCSTRVRDALDAALGGALRAATDSAPARLDWRGHTRRLAQSDFWLYLGLETVLGWPVDRPISRWDEMFIPGVLAEVVAEQDGLVLEERVIHAATLESPPATPGSVWPRYLLASTVLLVLLALAGRRWRLAGLARAWLVLTGVAGLVQLFFWFGTDHAVAAWNANLLLLNPLCLALLAGQGAARLAWPLVTVSGIAAVAQAVLPGQYTADVVAALLPLNLGAAWVLRAGMVRG